MKRNFKFSIDRSLLLILVVAFVLRFVGIWYGLPAMYNSDEPSIVGYALSFGAKKSLEPTFMEYPTFYFYFLFVVYGIYFLVGNAIGIYNSILDFGASYFLNPTGLFLVGRFVSAILGTLTVLMVFQIGQRFFSRKIGFFSALIIALSFTHVSRSHWVLLEAGVGFLSALALYLILRYYENPSTKRNFFAGLISGLAISTKYNVGFIFVPLFLASIYICKKDVKKLFVNLGLSGASLVFGFLLGSPYWLFSFASFFNYSIKYTFSHVTYGVVGHITSIPFLWPFWELVVKDWTVGFLLLAGFIYVLFIRERKQILLFSFALPTLLYIGSWASADIHYAVPIYPALAILAAVFLNDIIQHLPNRALKITVAFLLLITPIIKIVHYDIRLTQKDTRAFAEEWIESNIPDGSVIGYENYVYGPNLFDPSRFLKNEAESRFLPLPLKERILQERYLRVSYNLINFRKDLKPPGFAKYNNEKRWMNNPYFRELLQNRLPKLSTLRKAGVEYLVISSDNYRQYFSRRPPKQGTPVWFSYLNGRNFYKNILSSNDLILLQEFRPTFWNLGPVIRIYKFESISYGSHPNKKK
jgi:hypothetical protein